MKFGEKREQIVKRVSDAELCIKGKLEKYLQDVKLTPEQEIQLYWDRKVNICVPLEATEKNKEEMDIIKNFCVEEGHVDVNTHSELFIMDIDAVFELYFKEIINDAEVNLESIIEKEEATYFKIEVKLK